MVNDISIERKKERKKEKKRKEEGERICNEKASLCVPREIFVYSPRLRSRDTSAILFGSYSQGVGAQDRKWFTRRGDLSRLCEFPPCSGLGPSGESGRSRCMVGHRIGDPISAFPLPGKVLSG